MTQDERAFVESTVIPLRDDADALAALSVRYGVDCAAMLAAYDAETAPELGATENGSGSHD